MIDLGNYSLAMAVLLSAVAILGSLAAGRLESAPALRLAKLSVAGVAGLFTLASIILIAALLDHDFRLDYVARYTERALPTGYLLAAFWAGQEGSLLLWAWMLGAMSVVTVYLSHRNGEPAEQAGIVGTLAAVCGFFAALMLFAANPFALAPQVLADGHGLNPMLQDPGMIAHPPALFLGYAACAVPFALMVGALIAGRRDNDWIVGIRRWTIVAWLFLTIGIILGAQWAYVELGWGGYWAWDPVENASLLPWLTATALLHSIMPQQHRGMFKRWNVSLIAVTFILCIFGTYLTRSGVIQSVHSFGESVVGTFFLGFLGLTIVVSAALVALRWKSLRGEHSLEVLLGREAAFLAVNVLLSVMTLATLVGTILPLLTGNPIVAFFFPRWSGGVSVGENYYNKLVVPMGLLLAGLMAAGPLLIYGTEATARFLRGMIIPIFAGAIGAAALAAMGIINGWALFAGFITAAGLTAIVIEVAKAIWARAAANDEVLLVAAIRTFDGNHRRYGGQLVHVGVFMVVAGIIGSSVFSNKQTFQLKPGQSAEIAGQIVKYEGMREVREPNYTAMQADVTLTGANGVGVKVSPQRRFYDKSEQPNSEVSIRSDWDKDTYVMLAGWSDGGNLAAIQVMINPLVSWIWIGGIVMTLGGLLCLMPRLLPVAQTEAIEQPAPARAGGRKAVKLAAAR